MEYFGKKDLFVVLLMIRCRGGIVVESLSSYAGGVWTVWTAHDYWEKHPDKRELLYSAITKTTIL